MKHFNGCGRAGLLAVTSEKNTAPSVPLEAYGRVFVIEPTYPEVCVACVREEKKKKGRKKSLAFLSVASYFTYASKKNDLFLCSGSFMEKAVSLPRRLDDIFFTGVQRLL